MHHTRSTTAPALRAAIAPGLTFLGLFAAVAPAAAQPADPLASVTALHVAVNAHDIDGALRFFTDDAVVWFPNQPPPKEFRGIQEVRAWLEADAAQHIQVAAENLRISGDRLTWTARVDTDDLRAAGVTAFGTVEAVMRGDKFASFTFTLSDETLAKLQAATPHELP